MTWDVRGQLNQVIIRFGEACDGIVLLANDSVQVVRVLTAELYLEVPIIGEPITNDRGDNIVGLILSSFEEELFIVLRIKILPGQKVFNEDGSRFAESVREDGAEGILEAHLLAETLINRLVAVAEKLPELTDRFQRNVAGGDNVKLEEVSNPHGILVIGLLPLNSPDIFKVSNNDMEIVFKTLKMGIQYLPVDSMQTSEQLLRRSQSGRL